MENGPDYDFYKLVGVHFFAAYPATAAGCSPCGTELARAGIVAQDHPHTIARIQLEGVDASIHWIEVTCCLQLIMGPSSGSPSKSMFMAPAQVTSGFNHASHTPSPSNHPLHQHEAF